MSRKVNTSVLLIVTCFILLKIYTGITQNGTPPENVTYGNGGYLKNSVRRLTRIFSPAIEDLVASAEDDYFK